MTHSTAQHCRCTLTERLGTVTRFACIPAPAAAGRSCASAARKTNRFNRSFCKGWVRDRAQATDQVWGSRQHGRLFWQRRRQQLRWAAERPGSFRFMTGKNRTCVTLLCRLTLSRSHRARGASSRWSQCRARPPDPLAMPVAQTTAVQALQTCMSCLRLQLDRHSSAVCWHAARELQPAAGRCMPPGSLVLRPRRGQVPRPGIAAAARSTLAAAIAAIAHVEWAEPAPTEPPGGERHRHCNPATSISANQSR